MGSLVRSPGADPTPLGSDAQPPSAEKPPRAYRSIRAWATLLAVLVLGLGLDLGSKAWSFATVAGRPVEFHPGAIEPELSIPHHPGRRVLPWRLLELQLVINRGAVFGIGEDQRFFFIAFTLAALSAGLLVFGWHTNSGQRLAHASIGLILAGGLGNLHDRVVHGFVRDFLHLLPEYTLPFDWTWPGGSPELFPWVFNVADALLLLGMGLLLVHMSRADRLRRANAAAAVSQPVPDLKA